MHRRSSSGFLGSCECISSGKQHPRIRYGEDDTLENMYQAMIRIQEHLKTTLALYSPGTVQRGESLNDGTAATGKGDGKSRCREESEETVLNVFSRKQCS